MSTSSVIFMGSPEENLKGYNYNNYATVKLLNVSPHDVLFRIFASFIPPFTKKYQKVYIDLQGPVLALFILMALVNYGYTLKNTNISWGPIESILFYSVSMPTLCFFLCKLGHSSVSFREIVCLLGYALYGHILTLLVSYLCFQERSNFFFFVCLVFFGGLSTLRLALVLLRTFWSPGAILLVCTIVSVFHVLFLIFLHFAYMHRNFVYRGH